MSAIIENRELESMILEFIEFKEKYKNSIFFDTFKIAVNSKSKKLKFRNFLKDHGYAKYIDEILIVKTQVKEISY